MVRKARQMAQSASAKAKRDNWTWSVAKVTAFKITSPIHKFNGRIRCNDYDICFHNTSKQ
jgi:hypothetical protein